MASDAPSLWRNRPYVYLLGAAESAAFLFLALPAGAWVDRMSHRRVMIAANLVRASLLALSPLESASSVANSGDLPRTLIVLTFRKGNPYARTT